MRLPRQVSNGASRVPLTWMRTIWIPILYTAIASMPTQLRLWREADRMWDRNSVTIEDGKKFDFIVVGAGLAGGVVANRLSREGYQVLLLEAGGEPFPLQLVPGFLMLMINNPETDWMHRTVAQKKASLNSVNQESSWSVGKGLGGTGTLNIMIYLRGHKKDFDNWAHLVNDSSWSFEGLIPHFNEIEDYTQKPGPIDKNYHGVGGDLAVDEPDYLGIADEFVAAAAEMGYPRVDLNAPYKEGFDRVKYPVKDGRRTASYSAFIQPARRWGTLTVLKYAHVNKVLIRDDNTIYGVEYERHGEVKRALAKKEVILSSGSVNTAKILMLSGIGPKQELEKHGIPVRRDLPVGMNLQDHIGVYLHPFFVEEPAHTIQMERDFTPRAVAAWMQSGRGILSSSGVQASGCISSSFAKARGEGDWPDIHYFLFGFSTTPSIAKIVAKAFNLELDEMEKYYKHGEGRDSFYIIVTGARPYSRGYIQLRSKDPKEEPLIDPKYLEDENDTDLKVLLEATKKAVLMVENSTAIGANLGGKFTTEKLPGCEHLEFRSDEYWICYIRRYSVTLHHPVGTARMGRIDDPKAVVDTRLRVIGTKGLRVVDSSIQPVIIVTNTGASAMMIGEKGSHMIIQDWYDKPQDNNANTDFISSLSGIEGQGQLNTNINTLDLDNRLRKRFIPH